MSFSDFSTSNFGPLQPSNPTSIGYSDPMGTSSMGNNSPSFNAPVTNPNFGSIQTLLQPNSNGLSAPYQNALDIINKQRDYYAGLGESAARGLATQRGISGSSTEQFGVQQAINQANLSAMNATSTLLGQGALDQSTNTRSLAGLTSDEIASQRNMGLSQQALQLQQQLGLAGLNQGQQNIDAAKQMAQQQARNQLFMGGAQLFAPSIMNGLGLGGGGGGLFGGGLSGGAGATGALGGFTPYAAGGLPGPFAYGAGTAAGGAGGLGGGIASFASSSPMLALAAGGIGASLLASQGQKYGGTLGSIMANPIGAQINLAKNAFSSGGNAISNVGKSIENGVSSVFRF